MNDSIDIRQSLEDLIQEFNDAKDKYDEIDKAFEFRKKKFESESVSIKKLFDEEKKEIEKQKIDIIKLAKERQIGFPTLAKAYDEFFELQDKNLINFLSLKNRPAFRASEVISEFAILKRKAERENKILKYIIEYYESIAPFLVDLKEEVSDISEEERQTLSEYTEEELEDKATQYLTKEEYRKLPSIEKNQMALERYWKRPKSKRHIGKIYERYVGYIFEEKGYKVEYHGIFKGLEDLGRDILADNGKELVVIQCKNWSKFRTIYEKHIFQFFGTLFQYKDENKSKKVRGIFYTTTSLSDLARRFAKELNIELVENDKINTSYPCIKCNISRIDKTKIYHLPFDQQYDNVKIEKEIGEFYCSTIKEAEEKGFRRAFKYKGTKE